MRGSLLNIFRFLAGFAAFRAAPSFHRNAASSEPLFHPDADPASLLLSVGHSCFPLPNLILKASLQRLLELANIGYGADLCAFAPLLKLHVQNSTLDRVPRRHF